MSDWRELGECSGGPLSMWFPGRGETAAPAKAVCRTCDVRAQCLEWALANSVQFGVWGWRQREGTATDANTESGSVKSATGAGEDVS